MRFQRRTLEPTLALRLAADTAYCEAAKAGDKKAMDAMITRHTPFAVRIASRYRWCGLEWDDIVQCALLGLVAAVKRFDGSHAFTTYAQSWVKAKIIRCLAETGREIRLPANVYAYAQAARMRLRDGKKLTPSHQEGLSALEATETASETKIVFTGSQPREIIHLLPDPNPLPDAALDQRDAERRLSEVLITLSPKERVVITERYGIGVESPRTLQQIGDDMGVSRERVRQIEAIAWRKMQIIANRLNGGKIFKPLSKTL